MKKTIIEICTGSLSDCIAAYEGGADRVELNSAMFLGGLTPTVATLKLVKRHCPGLKIISMVRPRAAGFCYDETEYEVCFLEAKELLEAGSDGIVFGFLNNDLTIRIDRTSKMVKLIKSYGKEAVFHRAFDCVSDQDVAIKQLIESGVDRVLTSGGYPTAIEGVEQIAYLQENYGNSIEILAGSGVRTSNAMEIIEKTKVTQIHSSCSSWKNDPTTTGTKISYAFDSAHLNEYNVTSLESVKELINAVRV